MDMSPESWTQAEVVRALERIEGGVEKLSTELRQRNAEFVPRDVYASDQKSLAEYKQAVAVDIVNLEAEQARIRKDLRAEVSEIRAGQRWAIGVAVTAFIGAVGSFISMV